MAGAAGAFDLVVLVIDLHLWLVLVAGQQIAFSDALSIRSSDLDFFGFLLISYGLFLFLFSVFLWFS